MRITKATIFLFATIGWLITCRQKNNLTTAADNKSLLWEITGNNLKQPSYFLGTMHIMCAQDAELSPVVKGVIAGVKQVYLEVDLDNPSELMSGVFDLTATSKESLSDVLPQEEYDRVKTFFENYRPTTPFDILEKQHPLILSSSLYELFLPCEKKNGVEVNIVEEAYARKKETKGLETIAFQTSLFNQISFAEQAKELVKTIDSLSKFKQSMEEMIRIYKAQDIEQLHTLTTKEDSGISSHTDVLLYKRNHNWVKQFPVIATAKATLFAVGAAHLGGEQGVINLLRKQGYSVRPINNK